MTTALVVHLVALWLPVNAVGLAILWKQNLNLRQLVQAPHGDQGETAADTPPLTRRRQEAVHENRDHWRWRGRAGGGV